MQQQAFILWFGDAGAACNNLAALNQLLNQGWKVVSVTPMSGTGERGNETPQSKFPYSRAVVIMQR
jgi:cytolysin (calcineurin-like family phosphatase)